MKDKDFGDRLKYLRKKRGLTQTDAALWIGLSYKALQDHEGGRWPNRKNQTKYLQYYKCNKNWFLTGEGEPYDIEVDVHDQVKGNDSLQVVMRGPDGRIRPEDSGTVDAHGRAVDNLSVGSPRHEYSATIPGYGLGQAVEMLSNVLRSGDQVLVRTILSNLEASSHAADQNKRQSDRIEKLKKECEELKKRITSLEKLLEALKQEKPPEDIEERRKLWIEMKEAIGF